MRSRWRSPPPFKNQLANDNTGLKLNVGSASQPAAWHALSARAE